MRGTLWLVFVGMGSALWAACSSDGATTETPPATNDAGGTADASAGSDSGSGDTGAPVDGGADAQVEAGGGLEPGPYRIVYSGTGGTGIDQRRPVTITVSSTGQLDSWKFGTDATTMRGTAKVGELHADSSSLLGRWNDGDASGFPSGTKTYTDKGGFHYALVPDSATAPTTGTIAYALAKATAATIDDGSLGVGSVTAKLGVLYDAAGKKGGFELTIDMPGDAQYTATTTGGAADPAQSTELSGTAAFPLISGEIPVTGTGAACQGASPCKATLRMYVGGGANGAARAVLAYVVGSGTTAKTLRGTVVFRAP